MLSSLPQVFYFGHNKFLKFRCQKATPGTNGLTSSDISPGIDTVSDLWSSLFGYIPLLARDRVFLAGKPLNPLALVSCHRYIGGFQLLVSPLLSVYTRVTQYFVAPVTTDLAICIFKSPILTQ